MVADNHAHAQRAARLVRVEYEDIKTRIITIEVCFVSFNESFAENS